VLVGVTDYGKDKGKKIKDVLKDEGKRIKAKG
jgi:hypothetical protein